MPSSSRRRSSASVVPSGSAPAAARNQSRASSSRPAASSRSAYAYQTRADHGRADRPSQPEVLQRDQCGIELTEIPTRARFDDPHLCPLGRRQPLHLG